MITRKSFFIRWLLVRDIYMKHIQSRNKRRVSNLEEAAL